MKNTLVCQVTLSDGEFHYVFNEASSCIDSKNFPRLRAAEAKELSKREASKPLFIAREY
jgi:hypothetical protein